MRAHSIEQIYMYLQELPKSYALPCTFFAAWSLIQGCSVTEPEVELPFHCVHNTFGLSASLDTDLFGDELAAYIPWGGFLAWANIIPNFLFSDIALCLSGLYDVSFLRWVALSAWLKHVQMRISAWQRIHISHIPTMCICQECKAFRKAPLHHDVGLEHPLAASLHYLSQLSHQ